MNQELSFEAMPFEFESEFQGESFEWESESGGARPSPKPKSGLSSASTAGQRPGRPAYSPARTKKPPVRKPSPSGFRPRAPQGIIREPSERVRWVQDSLNRILGLRLPLDGIMRPEIRSAVRSFQKRERLLVSGIVGPDTERALIAATARTPAIGPTTASEPTTAIEPTPASEPALASEPTPASELEELYFEAPTVTPASHLTTPSLKALEAMNCRLLCASLVAYGSASYPKAEYQSYSDNAGFTDGPPVVITGKKTGPTWAGGNPLDQCLIGTLNGPAPGQKSVVLAFRGTVPDWKDDWLNDFEAVQVPFTKVQSKNPGVLVHKGFHDSVESFFGKGIVKTIKARLNGKEGARRLYITGHSKGGALAYLAALLLRTMHPEIPVAGVISFEAPRPGNPSFVKAYNATGIPTLRYEFQDDIAPHLPPSGTFARNLGVLLANPVLAGRLSSLYPIAARRFTYEHAGTLCFIDWSGRIVGDSTVLQIKRMAGLTTLLPRIVAGGRPRESLERLHSISCSSGAWRAICKADVCPSVISTLAGQKELYSINRFS